MKNIYQNIKSLISNENIFRIFCGLKLRRGPLGEILFLRFSYRRYESDEQRAIKGKIVDYSKKGNILTQYTAFIGVTDEETPVTTQAAAQRINPEPEQPSYSHYERFVLLFKFYNKILQYSKILLINL